MGLEVIIGVGNVFLDGILTDEAHDIFFFSGHICFVCNNDRNTCDTPGIVDWIEKKWVKRFDLYCFFVFCY